MQKISFMRLYPSFLNAFTEKVVKYLDNSKKFILIRQWGIDNDELKTWIENKFSDFDELQKYIFDMLIGEMGEEGWNKGELVMKYEHPNAKPQILTDNELDKYIDRYL